MTKLSTLEEIRDLRQVWPHEASDFTPWLSEEENMALLSDAIGIDITVDERESDVGDFSVDIFASETGTGRKVIRYSKKSINRLKSLAQIWNLV